ncbi:MAG: hypothetical protein DRQ55_15335 [Planctomycetota bacterium]|nr:MAG: hypothetical protein DRQ55_15335 [Planctomycetota bacterium]
MDEVERIRDEFTDLWGRLASFWGIAPATGRLYGWLVTQAEPVDAETMSKGLGMSRGAVSMACRELVDYGLVHPERTAGSRRVRYHAEDDLEKVVRAVVTFRKRREWDPVLERLNEWIPRLKGDRRHEAKVLRQRLTDISSLVGVADDMACMFLKGGVVPKLGLKLLLAKASGKRR